MNYLPAFRLRLYRNFKAIAATDYHGIVRYYEQHEAAIGNLDLEEYFDCTWAYTNALFEIGNFGQHLVMCDHLLELVIIQNIETWDGADIYAKLLFKKAAALFQLQDYPKCAYVLRELIKLQPNNQMTQRFLRACLLRQKPAWLMTSRTVAIVLTFLTAAVIALELFVVHPLFPAYYELALYAHNILLVSTLATLAGSEFWHGWRCHQEVRSFARQMYVRKKAQQTYS